MGHVDLRIIRTKQLIKTAFLDLIDEHGFESVTVKAIMGILSGNETVNSGSIHFTYHRGEEVVHEDRGDIVVINTCGFIDNAKEESINTILDFVEAKNIIKDRPMVAKEFEGLINELLKSNSPKKWFRAYFNHGLINYIYGQKRLLPCDMAFDTFFIDPYGDVMPCNGTKEKEVMGNLNETDWDTLWNSEQADRVREKVRHCDRQCWMIGSVSPAMHKYIWVPAAWVIKHKFLRFFKENKYSMYENKICRDYRDGKVTKAELDKLSTCDMNAQINDGLSEKSREQLKSKTGEEIVDADIMAQLK